MTTAALPLTRTGAPPRGERVAGTAGRGTGGAVVGEQPAVVAVEDVASAAFFRTHYPRLAGWCRTLVDDDETAHDVAAEAFTRLLTKRRQLDDPRGYLYTIAVNLVRDHWRKVQRERRSIRQVIAGRPPQTLPPPVERTELRILVESLPDRLRAPVLLHYYADFAVADVARLLGRRPGTVKSDLFDARTQLRAALGDTTDRGRPEPTAPRPGSLP